MRILACLPALWIGRGGDKDCGRRCMKTVTISKDGQIGFQSTKKMVYCSALLEQNGILPFKSEIKIDFFKIFGYIRNQ